MDNLYVGRQAIFDRNLNLHAYELLFRDGTVNKANFENSDLASSTLISNAFVELGLEDVVGSNRAFINISRSFLVGDQQLPMPNEQVVLEILEDIEIDEPALKGFHTLVEHGYQLALDDFRFTPEYEDVLKEVDYVKLDFLSLTPDEIRAEVDNARRYQVKLVAEKVETETHYQLGKDLGFEYFQGYYFCRPHVLSGKPIPSNNLVMLSLMSKLEDPNSDIKQLEQLISQDAALSYRLLRYINSASFALRKEVDSIRQAIIMIGSRTIRNWANLLLLSKAGTDKPAELLVIAMVRAKMCESLASNTHECVPDRAFTVGLFSCLDALLDRPMADVLDQLPLTGELKLALMDNEGPLGELLHAVIGYEQGQWSDLDFAPDQIRNFSQAWIEAVVWADESHRALADC